MIPISTAAMASLKPGINVLASHTVNKVGGHGIDWGIVKSGQ